MVAGTDHYDFPGYPVVVKLLGNTPTSITTAEGPLHLETLEGNRALENAAAYVGAFLDFVVYGKCSEILLGQ